MGLEELLLAEAKNEGRLEGKLEGKLEGRLEGKLEGKLEEALAIARELKKEGLPIEFISKTTKLSIRQIEELVCN